MGMCTKVCEIYRNKKFCRAVIQNCDTCKHYKYLCETGGFCAWSGTCLVKKTAKETPNE